MIKKNHRVTFSANEVEQLLAVLDEWKEMSPEEQYAEKLQRGLYAAWDKLAGEERFFDDKRFACREERALENPITPDYIRGVINTLSEFEVKPENIEKIKKNLERRREELLFDDEKKSAIFFLELLQIKNKSLHQFFEKAVEGLPTYVFFNPLDDTFPKYTQSDGGLVRYTKATIMIAFDLLKLEQNRKSFNSDEKDMIIGALILASCRFYNHKGFPVEYLRNGNFGELPSGYIDIICDNIVATENLTGVDKPETAAQQLVRTCNYLAKKRYLTVELGIHDYDPGNFILEKWS